MLQLDRILLKSHLEHYKVLVLFKESYYTLEAVQKGYSLVSGIDG